MGKTTKQRPESWGRKREEVGKKTRGERQTNVRRSEKNLSVNKGKKRVREKQVKKNEMFEK